MSGLSISDMKGMFRSFYTNFQNPEQALSEYILNSLTALILLKDSNNYEKNLIIKTDNNKIIIIDNGIGIEPNQLKDILNNIYKIKERNSCDSGAFTYGIWGSYGFLSYDNDNSDITITSTFLKEECFFQFNLNNNYKQSFSHVADHDKDTYYKYLTDETLPDSRSESTDKIKNISGTIIEINCNPKHMNNIINQKNQSIYISNILDKYNINFIIEKKKNKIKNILNKNIT